MCYNKMCRSITVKRIISIDSKKRCVLKRFRGPWSSYQVKHHGFRWIISTNFGPADSSGIQSDAGIPESMDIDLEIQPGCQIDAIIMSKKKKKTSNFTVQTPFGRCWLIHVHIYRFEISAETKHQEKGDMTSTSVVVDIPQESQQWTIRQRTVDQYPPHPRHQKPHKQSSNIAMFKVFSRSDLPMEKAPGEFKTVT